MKSTENPLENSEWRIKSIPFRDKYAMMETNWGALLGALLFFIGIAAGFKIKILFLISIAGLLLMLVSTFIRGRNVRKNWVKISAQCIDREIKHTLGRPGPRGGVRRVWTFQLLCEYEMNERQYTVTPGYWTTFISEHRLQTFLEKVISSDGQCQLWVNPDNPLQTELVANDIKDLLLH